MAASLTELAATVGQFLTQHGKLLATAESCTGGGVAYAITEIAGSSTWFDRGFVTYSNQAKIDMLGVPTHIIDTHGAVSQETAHAMAIGALKHSQAHISVAITGVAGPTGGSIDKPVGTIWFAWAWYDQTNETSAHSQIANLTGDRHSIRMQSIEIALVTILKLLK